MKARTVLGAGAVSAFLFCSTLLVDDAHSSDADAVQFPPCQAIEELRSSAGNNSTANPSLPIDRSLLYVPPTTAYLNTASLGPMVRCASCAFSAMEEFESDPTNLFGERGHTRHLMR